MGDINLPAKVINGCVAGVVGVTCTFPIDLVKTRLQNQQVIDGKRIYNNLLDCFIKTTRAEGLRGLYHGYAVNATLISPEKAIKLVGNDFFRHLLRTPSGHLPLYRETIAGGGAGFCQVIITTPMEMLKIQLQDAGRKKALLLKPNGVGSVSVNDLTTSGKLNPVLARSYSANTRTVPSSGLAIARDLIQTKGFFGLYQGLGATLMRDIPFSMIYFPFFAHLNALGFQSEETRRASFLHTFVSGSIAATTAAVSVNPVDVIKTRLQLLEHAEGEETYTGVRDCFTKILKHEGPQAFFKGATCRILVIAPLFGIAQAVYYFGVGEYMIDHFNALTS
ncbi:mitochondrial glutamate carrier 2 isoform X2 [Strongylocentrotus purpuratus]|uniref:Mitochondrial glutamate carrier 2 n=1 Tax=Strongylocentrotus purpuratus TaxID=7668 RepID=A0A7M7P075_STRPU|nr:mitochondrial glutamate carrier 2 isoform X1 [Strongylocentrotus purpuratus]XP_030844273.1 mitochondrial glutamate carrier 2 isoform X2 [Strongylocentrotus purpuratus]